jgi:hypothetical protein
VEKIYAATVVSRRYLEGGTLMNSVGCIVQGIVEGILSDDVWIDM